MEKNTQLPAEVTEEIKLNAEDFANKHINGRAQPDAWEIVFKSHETAATAYATKLHEANETIKVLTYDNNKLKGEAEVYKIAVEELKRQNDKLKEKATGWRPLLEEVLSKPATHTLLEKIKKYLYGE